MATDTEHAFRFMQVNYRYGLLDEMGSIVGDALESVLIEEGMDMEDVFNRLDGAGEETVEKVNRVLERWGHAFLRLAANGTMTRLQAYLLKKPFVRGRAVAVAKRVLRKRLAPERVPPPEACREVVR